MKLHEEFKEYENLWDKHLKEEASYIKTFEGEKYNLTRRRDLRNLIDALIQKELGLKRPLRVVRSGIIQKLMKQLKSENVDPSILSELEDIYIEEG